MTREAVKIMNPRPRGKKKARKTSARRARHQLDTSYAGLLARYQSAVAKELQRLFTKGPRKSFSGTRGLQYYPPECMVLDK